MLTAYLQAGLEAPQAAEVEEHLATCAECAKECEGARAVREVPQEGRFQAEVGERKLDFRVSTVPTVAGPSLVIRLFDESGAVLTLDRVNLVGEQRAQLEKLIGAPQGIVFVTGPTGSGKTTTLYAILNELNSPERHIMSIENPVGYRLEGVTQISVNPQTGLDFQNAMRSVMMQDPDVIMCGEVRDLETLELCFQAAVWGHLVLTTVHTLDAVSALRRVLDVGADCFMVTEAFLGSTCQRLLRRICSACKEEVAPTEEELQWLHEAGATELPEKLWRGGGCDQCKQTGHRGRAAAYEIFVMDEETRGMLASGASLDDVEKAAVPKVTPMKQSAAAMVLAGEVDATEAMRVLP